jgi:hypothetical protein
MSDYFNNQTPAELRPIESALDELARAERGSAPAGLEDRIAAATADQLLAPTPLRITVVSRTSSFARLRIAAGVLLVGALVAVIGGRTAFRSPPPSTTPGTAEYATTQLEEDVELWLAMRTPEEFDDVSTRLDLLSVETESLKSPSASTDWMSILEPGAM